MINTDSFISKVQNTMRGDPGIDDKPKQINQITWILFLKVYYAKEQERKTENLINNIGYKSIIPKKYQWNNWAKNTKEAPKGERLIKFINHGLIPTLRNIPYDISTPGYQAIVPEIFSHVHNYMQDGTQLRKVINDVDSLRMDDTEHDVEADIYEHILGQMQSQANSGEYYTPRPITNFVTSHLDIKLGDKIGDFAVGTGGFLTSALDILRPQEVNGAHDVNLYNNSVYGRELHFPPFLLCITNLFLHDIDDPHVVHGDSLNKDVTEYQDKDKFNVIAMNPPYGKDDKKEAHNINFPAEFRSGELSDSFLTLVMYRLKLHGRAGIVLPDSFMFGTSDVKEHIKQHLFNNFNVKLIIRLPKGVFSPYTSINTNLVFFDNTHPTTRTWFYRIDLPKGMKQFTKTRPITKQSFKGVSEWLKHPKAITNKNGKKAEQVPINLIKKRKYDLSFVGFGQKHTVIKDPMVLLNDYLKQKHQYDQKISKLVKEVKSIFGGKDND